ncbi:hypothetical protein [Paraburkholderia domus]|jgi:hypothetical protein|uniref:hypothetical protein n=1 Tax=Paraburkholderia domus TaxID=2793075 RepID=UPI001911E5FF|nr:hypothetical protein [Paraburkholderia domus]MBK5047172.1 hypothetical protein [Burkholderia sp. R-70006]MBK5059081.1 hypothetical protein [Burkholderia sp. R-70199]MBK5086095.1 hypothetical protein [Burkholderia sp. R-69927]MBK5119122.1 hypothetical protein [Burkholderia sp. R-69980]MBK5163163.1 hypothetical protein [Burkholderia sp. R-70211]MBK5178959.1 hypothetical protein [Burkholderia sp. R-69749]MCI0145241.1 hypothetical protein [Paraburkholderia sediminicola]
MTARHPDHLDNGLPMTGESPGTAPELTGEDEAESEAGKQPHEARRRTWRHRLKKRA